MLTISNCCGEVVTTHDAFVCGHKCLNVIIMSTVECLCCVVLRFMDAFCLLLPNENDIPTHRNEVTLNSALD